ncbi:MAG: hypothetical protein PHP50_00845 [Lachnospiraceae bacterium]|nr:hypothetical protein [Lachnospiraceae bacterium]
MSGKIKFRTLYMLRFLFRVAVFVITVYFFLTGNTDFEIMMGFHFFDRFTFFHILWICWMFDMIMQLLPVEGYWPLGSRKQFARYYQKREAFSGQERKILQQVTKGGRDTLIIGAAWSLVAFICAVLYSQEIFSNSMMMVIAVFFYVSDTICVLFFCPFRLFMKNRCCVTCRIFNWDHLMMFVPFLMLPGFYTWSLLSVAAAIFIVWEYRFYRYPERFLEEANENLRCMNCQEHLCGRPNMGVNKILITQKEEKKDAV